MIEFITFVMHHAKMLSKIYAFCDDIDDCVACRDCITSIETSCGKTAKWLTYLLTDNIHTDTISSVDSIMEHISNNIVIICMNSEIPNPDAESHVMLCAKDTQHDQYLVLDSYFDQRSLSVRSLGYMEFQSLIKSMYVTHMTQENWCHICDVEPFKNMTIADKYKIVVHCCHVDVHNIQHMLSKIHTLCEQCLLNIPYCKDYNLYVFHEKRDLVLNHDDNMVVAKNIIYTFMKDL